MENPKHIPIARLPQEILSEIFSRLPVKSVGKFRCASKGWNSLLTSQQFIKTHLARITPFLPEKLLLLGPRALFSVRALDLNVLDGVSVDFDKDSIKFGGSCDGLVLVLGAMNSKILINPITRQFRKLPNSPLALNQYSSYSMHGFGYDSSSDDYKIVTLSYFDPENSKTPDDSPTFIDVYSLKSNSWRRKGISPYDHYSKSYREATASGVLLNGALHWLASNSSSTFISAFNLASENFGEISGPTSLDTETLKCCKLMVIRGCLGIVDDKSNEDVVCISYDKINVFIMKVYGSADSWTRIVVNLESAVRKKAICSWNGVLFLSVDDDLQGVHDFVGYFFKDDDWRYLDVENGEYDDGLTFREPCFTPLQCYLTLKLALHVFAVIAASKVQKIIAAFLYQQLDNISYKVQVHALQLRVVTVSM